MPPEIETPPPESFDDWLYDPPALPREMALPAWAWWLLGALALAFLIVGLLKLRRHLVIPKLPKEPRIEALRSLYDLRSRAETLPPSDIGSGLAATLNRYLHRRYGALAEFHTRSELFDPASRPHGSPPLPPGVATRFADLMARSEELRFAGRKASASERRETVVATLKALEGEPA